MRATFRSFLFFLILLAPLCLRAQKSKPVRILILLDASGSMKDKWQNSTKFSSAKQILRQVLDSLDREKNVQVALRVFGHQSPRAAKDCKDSKLEVPFSPFSSKEIIKKLDQIEPQGYTPIAYSLSLSAQDFLKNADSRNMILLVTDGVENCEGDPCEASAKLQASGIFLKPYIIGLGLTEEQKTVFDCVGKVYDIKDEKETKTITSVVISNIINPTSLQINLLNAFGSPTETNLNMTFYNASTGQTEYNIYHTINASGNPDSLFLDPANEYDIEVHSLPSVRKKGIRLVPGKHTITAVDVPQGSLKISMTGAMRYKDLKVLVREKNNGQLINVQGVNTVQQYLTGTYDLEILTLPRIYLTAIPIEQSKTHTLPLPAPGTVNMSFTDPGYTSIFSTGEKGLTCIYTADPLSTKENLQLQPGNYIVVHRPKNASSTALTQEKPLKIISGTVVSLKW